MNAFAKVAKQTFLAFAASRPEERYELVRGRIVQQMSGGTHRHSLVARRLARSLEDQVDEAVWAVLPVRGVETADGVRYPDIVVEPADEPGESLSTKRPALIVEVLSPSSVSRDLDEKPSEYLALASLDAYIVASQDEPAMMVWLRDAAGRFPADGVELRGAGRQVPISARGFAVTLALDDIYRGLL